jgi:hypothetical protein
MRYWRRPKTGAIQTVESYSHDLDIPGAKEITREDYDAFLAALPAVEPFKSEVELLAEKVTALESRLAKVEAVPAVAEAVK